MDKKKLLNRALPYIVAVLCFAALSALYFSPQFEGRRILMHDIVQYEGAARDIKDHNERFGEDPQWTGNSFSGMPASLISMKYPALILKHVFPVLEFMGRPASLIFIAMAAFFVMLVLFGMNPWVAVLPALAYGFSTYFFIIIGAGHITKMVALAYAPLVVGAVFHTLRRNMWIGAALTALFASLLIAANHPQITYYFTFIIAALWINEGVRALRKKIVPRFLKATGLLAIAAVLALGSNFAMLWYINQDAKQSIRGGSELSEAAAAGEPERGGGLALEYATAWSYGIAESFNMYIPYLFGGSSEGNFSDDGPVAQSLAKYGARNMATSLPSYWGDQPVTAGPTYLGAVAVFLAVLGLFMLRPRKTVWIAAVSALAIMLAWGHNFMWLTKLFFYWFPGYDKFRTVAMILVIVQWSVPMLGALAVAKLWKNGGARKSVGLAGNKPARTTKGAQPLDAMDEGKTRLMKSLKYSVIVLGGISLFFLLFGGAIFDFTAPSDGRMGLPDDVLAAMRQERASMMRADAFRSLLFMLLAAGVVLGHAVRKIGRGWMVAALAVLVCVDLAVVNLRFLPHDKFVEARKTEIRPTDADLAIMADPEPGFRVLNLTVSPFNDATTSYFHRSVGGYHGAKLQRYQDVIDRYLSRMDINVINMLNTKYIIRQDEATGEIRAIVNPDALGAAWFVETVTVVDTPDEEIAALGTIDLRREAVADRRFAELLTATNTTADSMSFIHLTEYAPNRLKYAFYASDETFAVFSEVYYRGWRAFIDGQPAPHFRVNYILRGMVLPAGEHTVEFRYRADNFDAVSNITLIFSLLIIASVIAAIVAAVLCRRGKQNDEREQETAA